MTSSGADIAGVFAESVSSTIVAVQTLYGQIDRFLEGLVFGLRDGPAGLAPIGGTRLGVKPGRVGLDRHVRDSYRFLLAPGGVAGAEEEDEDDEGDDEGGLGGRAPARLKLPSGATTIDPLRPYLALSLVLVPQRGGAVGPHASWAVIREWAVGVGGPATEPFELRRRGLVEVLRAAGPQEGFDPHRWVPTAVSARRGRRGEATVSFRLAATPGCVPLLSVIDPGALRRLVGRIEAEWAAATGMGPAADR